MSKKVAEKLTELEYNEQITLTIVQGEEDLRNIFVDETKISSFPLLLTLSRENKLKEETQSFLRMIFDQVILTKQSLIDKYVMLARTDGTEVISKGNFNDVVVKDIPSVVEVSEPVIEKVKAVSKGKINDVKPALPRRYGKEKILKDIQDQGGKMTPLQNAMLKVNDLKNIYVNLSARGIKDMVGGTQLITDEDSRKIVSAITIVERQLSEILKRK